MNDPVNEIEASACRYGLSKGAADALFDALQAGGGRMAQFNHPDLGGMGQWSGGMTQIGDMFNDALRAKVSGFCQDMAGLARSAVSRPGGSGALQPVAPAARPGSWWPEALGRPASAGAQNETRYAFFPDSRRLAVSRDGRVTLYDTADHRLSGFSQQQPGRDGLSFTGQHGPVRLDSLSVVPE